MTSAIYAWIKTQGGYLLTMLKAGTSSSQLSRDIKDSDNEPCRR